MKLHEYFDLVTIQEALSAMDALDARSRFNSDDEYMEYANEIIRVYKYMKLASRVEERKPSTYRINVVLLPIEEGNEVAFMLIRTLFRSILIGIEFYMLGESRRKRILRLL